LEGAGKEGSEKGGGFPSCTPAAQREEGKGATEKGTQKRNWPHILRLTHKAKGGEESVPALKERKSNKTRNKG